MGAGEPPTNFQSNTDEPNAEDDDEMLTCDHDSDKDNDMQYSLASP